MTVNTLGSNEPDQSSRTVAEWLWPFLPMGISAFSLSALIWYHLRRDVFERDIHSALQLLYANLYKLVGFAPSVLFFLLTLTWSSIWFATGKVDRPLGRLGRLLAMMVMIGILINLGHGGVAPEVHKGELGAWLAEHLVGAFGYLASLLVVWAVTFASMLLATDFFFSDSFERLRAGHAPELATESGVEIAVTDHLRGLGPAAAPAVDVALPAPASEPAVAGARFATTMVEPSVEPLRSEEPSPEPEPRRRSYAERRRDRERRWKQEEWVPPALESQEIENPEASLRGAEASALAALDAAALDAAPPVPADPAAPAAVAPIGRGIEAAANSDLVDLDELEGSVGDDVEATALDSDSDGEEAVAEDDADDEAAAADDDSADTERDGSATPVAIERPAVIARHDAAPRDSLPGPVAAFSAEVVGNAIDDDAAATDEATDEGDEGTDEGDEGDEGVVPAAVETNAAETGPSVAAAWHAENEVDADDAAAAASAADEAEGGEADEANGTADDDLDDDDFDDDDDFRGDADTVAGDRAGSVIPGRPSIEHEPVVAIPRPEPPGVGRQVVWRAPQPPATSPPVEIPTPAPAPEPSTSREATAPREHAADAGTEERGAARQQQLFGSWLDEGLIQDAIEVITSTRRANAALLQRRLRIDYALAIDVLGALAARGLVELEGDSTQGRVLV